MMNFSIRPSKETIIPDGATHWILANVNPFYKKDEHGNWWQFYDDSWHFLPNKDLSCKEDVREILPPFETKGLDVVWTKLGDGFLLGQDLLGDYLVELKDNPKGYTPLRFAKKEIMFDHFYNKPCASEGLDSYRYKGNYGFVMIGATSIDDALNEAKRSIGTTPKIEFLEKWNGTQYVHIS
jgi:hypothetical protein